MNWSGLVFGGGLALAVLGAAGAAFAQRARDAVLCCAAAMLGVAAVCLALSNTFLAIVVALVPGAAVPAAMLAALMLAPIPEPDARAGRRGALVAAGIAVTFALLALLLTRSPWPPAGGGRQAEVEWIGSRLLTDHLLTLDLVAALLGLSALGAVALLRGRGPGR